MIKNKTVAREVSDLMIEVSLCLDGSIVTVKEQCPVEDFETYRRAVGSVLAEMLLKVLNPLYAEHPSLKPPELD